MELSPRPLISARDRDAIRLVDLRRLGAPVAVYATTIRRLVIDGRQVKLDRPAVAVIDTGTTGVTCSDSLFDFNRLPDRWREVEVGLACEGGGLCTLRGSVKRGRNPAVDADAPEWDEFPLIVSRTAVPWFDPGFGRAECDDPETKACAAIRARQPLGARLDALGRAPHGIFVGMALLWQRRVTIDIDENRMKIV